MAFPAETVTDTLVGRGHCVFKIDGTEIGRVIDCGEVDTAHTLYEHPGGNTGGTSQVVAIFENMEPSGKFTFTLDEVPDLDLATYQGLQSTVTIEQQFPADTDVGWILTADSAYVQYTGLKPNRDTPSTVTVSVTPYAAAGTATWSFDNANSYAV